MYLPARIAGRQGSAGIDEGGEDVGVGGGAVEAEMRGEEGEGRAGEGGVGEVGEEGGPSDGVSAGNEVEQAEGVRDEGGSGVGAEEEGGEGREEVEAELEEVGVEVLGGGGGGVPGGCLEEGEEGLLGHGTAAQMPLLCLIVIVCYRHLILVRVSFLFLCLV